MHTKPKLAQMRAAIEKEWPHALQTSPNVQVRQLPLGCMELSQLLSKETCQLLSAFVDDVPEKIPVSAQGLAKDIDLQNPGSERNFIWSETLSEALFACLKPYLANKQSNYFSHTDAWQDAPNPATWEPVAISPFFRVMRYHKNALHYAHYDAAYFYENKNIRSLCSVILYLSSTKKGGETRFFRDHQEHLPCSERNFTDHPGLGKEEDLLFSVQPEMGKVLVFDHRILHDAARHEETTPRYSIRTDLIYRLL